MKPSGIHSRSLCAVIISPGYTWRHRSGFASGFFQVLSQFSCLSFCFRLHLNLSDFHHTATVYFELLVWDNILIWLPHYVTERIGRRKNQNEKVSALTILSYGGAALLPQPCLSGISVINRRWLEEGRSGEGSHLGWWSSCTCTTASEGATRSALAALASSAVDRWLRRRSPLSLANA